MSLSNSQEDASFSISEKKVSEAAKVPLEEIKSTEGAGTDPKKIKIPNLKKNQNSSNEIQIQDPTSISKPLNVEGSLEEEDNKGNLEISKPLTFKKNEIPPDIQKVMQEIAKEKQKKLEVVQQKELDLINEMKEFHMLELTPAPCPNSYEY